MSIIRIGSNSKYASGWESAFGKGGKSATASKKTATKKKAAAPKKKAKKGKK